METVAGYPLGADTGVLMATSISCTVLTENLPAEAKVQALLILVEHSDERDGL